MDGAPVTTRVYDVDGIRLAAPADAERLLDAFQRPPGERRLPYWARLWPSSLVLARLVAGELVARVRGRAVVELGCGLGAVGLTAARAGADVTLTDREPEALELAADNARANGLAVQIVALEWSRVPDALVGRFDVVLGADLAYERDALAPLTGAIHALLVPGGEAWLADPGRLGPTSFVEAARAAGLDTTRDRVCPHPDGFPVSSESEAPDVNVYRLVRPSS